MSTHYTQLRQKKGYFYWFLKGLDTMKAVTRKGPEEIGPSKVQKDSIKSRY
jgi:hypothetical protein